MAMIELDGVPLHYEVVGEGEPILFLHGMGASWPMWEPQIAALREQFQLILVDLRFHGKSSAALAQQAFSYEAMMEDLPKLLQHLDIASAHVVGVSMGGVVAQMLAYSYPGYVKSLVLADTWCEMPDKTSKLVMALTVFLTKLLPVQFINKATYSLYKGDQPDQVYTREILSKSLKFTKQTFLAMKTTPLPKIKANLQRITAGTLVMYGDRKSYGIDEEKGARTIFREIPHSVLISFQDAFDPVTLMRKEECNAILHSFLKKESLPVLKGVFYEYK